MTVIHVFNANKGLAESPESGVRVEAVGDLERVQIDLVSQQPPQPPKPWQYWFPSCDLSEMNSNWHPNFLYSFANHSLKAIFSVVSSWLFSAS